MDQATANPLGREPIPQLLRGFAVPSIIAMLVSSLYNVVDQVFIGWGVGYLGNAATGVIFPITVIGWGLSLFFGDGAAAALSVSLGQGRRRTFTGASAVRCCAPFSPASWCPPLLSCGGTACSC